MAIVRNILGTMVRVARWLWPLANNKNRPYEKKFADKK
jgi:hypothetical protein